MAFFMSTLDQKESTMTASADNVRVGVTGAVYYAATTQALPTTLTAATTGFTDLGYVDEDGVTESQPTDTNAIKAWQNGTVVRRVQTSHELTYKFTLLETSTAVATLFYGAAGTTGTPAEITGAAPSEQAFIIDVVDGTNKRRICIPNGQITERDDVIYSNEDPYKYGVTITCYPDTDGTKAYVYEGVTA